MGTVLTALLAAHCSSAPASQTAPLSDVCGACTTSSNCGDPLGILTLTCVSGVCQVDASNGVGSCENSDCVGLCNETTQACSCSALCSPCQTASDCERSIGPALSCQSGTCLLAAPSSGRCAASDCAADDLGVCSHIDGQCLCGAVPSDVCGPCAKPEDCAPTSGQGVPLGCVAGICQVATTTPGTCDLSACQPASACDEATQQCLCTPPAADAGPPADVCMPCGDGGACQDATGHGVSLTCVAGLCQVTYGQKAGSCDLTHCGVGLGICEESTQECLCGEMDAGFPSDVCGPCGTSADCADGSGSGIHLVCAGGVCQVPPSSDAGTCDRSDCSNAFVCDEASQLCQCGTTPADICQPCTPTLPCRDASGSGVSLSCEAGLCQVAAGELPGSCDVTRCQPSGTCDEATQACECGVPYDAGSPSTTGASSGSQTSTGSVSSSSGVSSSSTGGSASSSGSMGSTGSSG